MHGGGCGRDQIVDAFPKRLTMRVALKGSEVEKGPLDGKGGSSDDNDNDGDSDERGQTPEKKAVFIGSLSADRKGGKCFFVWGG